MIKVQKSNLIKIIRDRQTDDRQMKLRTNTHGCELISDEYLVGLIKETHDYRRDNFLEYFKRL